jgi:hypothetical protein
MKIKGLGPGSCNHWAPYGNGVWTAERWDATYPSYDVPENAWRSSRERLNPSAFIAGVEAGSRYQFGKLVVGYERHEHHLFCARQRDRALRNYAIRCWRATQCQNRSTAAVVCPQKSRKPAISERTFTGRERYREGRSRFCWLVGSRIADHAASVHRDGRDCLRDWCAYRRRSCGVDDAARLSDVQLLIPPEVLEPVRRQRRVDGRAGDWPGHGRRRGATCAGAL